MKPISILTVFFTLVSLSLSAQNAGEVQLDTRIDNNGYWRKAAEMGLTTLNPVVPVARAQFTGSRINAISVITDDSPDVVLISGNTSQSENSVFANPNDPENVLNSNNSTSDPGFGLTLYGANDLYSFDAGLTWDGELQGAGGSNQGDPAALIGLDGRYYVGYIKNDGQGVAYSDDQGATWASVQVASAPAGFGNLLDKNHLWIDNSSASPYQGNLYDAWTTFGGANDSDVEISHSTDGGVTWSSSVNISQSINAGSHSQGVNIGTGPNGEVYAIFAIYDSWPGDENAIGLARSYDGGQTWETFRIIENIRGIRNYGTSKDMRVNSFPCMAVDISNSGNRGSLYVVWANVGVPGINQGPDIDIYVIKSEDEGDTWSSPVRVNQDDSGLGNEHYFPWITSDPATGTLSVIFYDDRNVSSNQCEVYCANSYDGGESWEDFKVSDVSFTPAPIPGLASGYFGDYLGISSQSGYVYPVWTDNRTGTALTYTSPYQTSTMAAPENLVAMLEDETGVVDLSWVHNGGPTFSHYNIYRNFTLIGTSAVTQFSDTLPAYGKYRYMVTAYYTEEGESGGAITEVQWGSASISIAPDSVGEILTQGGTSTRVITITNDGELPLEFSAGVAAPGTSPGQRAYCTANGGCGSFISSVMTGSIENYSNCGEYQDFTNLSTTMIVGDSYEIEILNGNNSSPVDQCGIWIDWDQDESFSDEQMIPVDGSPGVGPYTATIVPPDGAATGPARMRVRITRSSLSACGVTQYGEVEDYTVSVIGWLSAEGLENTVAPGEQAEITLFFDATGLANGLYEAQLFIESNDPDLPMTEVPVTLTVTDLLVTVTADKENICYGSGTTLHANVTGGSGTAQYSWTSDPEGFTSTDPDPMVEPEVTTTYFVEVTDGGITVEDQITITVLPLPEPDLGGDLSICAGSTAILDPGSGFATYNWSTGANTPTIETGAQGYYWVDVINESGCAARDSIYLTVNDLPLVDLGDSLSFCEGSSVVLDAGDGFDAYLWNDGSTEQTLEVNQESEYWVTVTDQNGCANSDTVRVARDPLPAVPGTPQGPASVDTYESTQSTVTTSGAEFAVQYRWELIPPEAGSIAGSGTEAVVTWQDDYTGTASVLVYGVNDCGEGTASEALEVNVYSSLSVGEITQPSVKLYPNPGNGTFTLSLFSPAKETVVIRVIDMQGKTVFETTSELAVRESRLLMNLENLPEGIYTLTVKGEVMRLEEKLIIKK